MALAIEVVAIGNEILTGFTINTNAAVIGNELLKIGLKVTAQRTLPDNAQQLKAGLEHSLNNFDLIICTGGLGPTCDDQTRQIIANLFNCELKFEAKIAEYLESRYKNRAVSIKDQAMIPSKAQYLLNDIGTASALIFNENGKLIIFLPGVPSELEHFMLTQIVPLLKTKYQDIVSEFHQQCNFMQISESQIDPMLRQLSVKYPQAEFGIYPNLGIISIHIVSHFATSAENLHYQQPIKTELIAAFKDHFFSDTSSKLEDTVCQICQQRNLSISILQTTPYLSLSALLSPVLIESIFKITKQKTKPKGDIGIIVTGIPSLDSDTEVYNAELKIELQYKDAESSVKIYNIRGNKAMLIKRAEHLVLAELYNNLCYTT